MTFFYKIIIFEVYLLIFKIGNNRFVDNIFLEKISHHSQKSNLFRKLVRSDSKE